MATRKAEQFADGPHPDAIAWLETAETRLATHFSGWVEQLDLATLIDQSESIAKPDQYKLIPITATTKDGFGSIAPAAWLFTLPENVRVRKTAHARPFLDTSFAIGLTYKDELQAAVAARLGIDGLIGEQIQAFVGPRNSGLYGGFAWQHPLVRGWMGIGRKLQADQMIITGSANHHSVLNYNAGLKRLQKELGLAGEPVPKTTSEITPEQVPRVLALGAAALHKNYDAVAHHLGFKEHLDGNWHLDLGSTAHA